MIGLICQSKKNPELTLKIFEGVPNLPEDWNNFLPENHHLQSHNVAFVSQSTNAKSIFLFAYLKADLVGLIYLQKVRFSEKDVNFPMLNSERWECVLKSFLSLSSSIQFLVCGNLFQSNFQGYYFKNIEHQELLLEYISEFVENSNEKYSGISIKESEKKIENLKYNNLNFNHLDDDLSMQMHIDKKWKSINDYCNDLSKKYRKRYVKIRAMAAKIEINELNIEDLIIHKKRIFELYEQTIQQQIVKIGSLNYDYFINAKKTHNEKFTVIGYFWEENLIGFSSHINKSETETDFHYIGIDYAYNEKFNLYFNIMFNGLEMAIDKGKCIMNLGRTSLTAKASMGAVPIEQFSYLHLYKNTSKISFWIVSKFFTQKIGEDWKSRNPFLNVKEA